MTREIDGHSDLRTLGTTITRGATRTLLRGGEALKMKNFCDAILMT